MFTLPFKKLKKDTSGATMIEFAFAGPVLLLLTFGFFEFCRALFIQGVLNYSAEQATRYAMVNFEQNNVDQNYLDSVAIQIKNHARDSFILIDENKITDFDVTVAVNPGDMTKTVSIAIDYNYSMIMPLVPQSTFTLTGKSESFLIQ
ncbi:TadE/TadG family type IV pilus assembly protein [Paremcibacter congregatus]|uniref:TadE-like domain-containing protein n=1 Tax=Paremcibacter congregatus TaxID=2043170 RepID=A0A2G4YML8_9PROT|nr:TadE/TadG family type IV pilus assembly protein [Paremcibacter congregatus]PHZ83545.1 hypothetical protein CRD36_16400 [Paremcibacter congregatus]QDE28369.1 pilus assembly protein [Paremcibacter congregatus]|tara:strand:- start:15826 stop:16266 length:441 start_codon:yes stop_codon:yes gene_type:complete